MSKALRRDEIMRAANCSKYVYEFMVVIAVMDMFAPFGSLWEEFEELTGWLSWSMISIFGWEFGVGGVC